MKRLLLLAAGILGLFLQDASANITITPATGGTNICANKAVGGSSAGFTTLGNIIVTEVLAGDITNIAPAPHGLIINLPAGWQFNTAAIPTLSFTPGRNITSVNFISLTATSLNISIFATNTTLLDQVTIAGLQVQATSAGAAAGNMTASTATGLTGIVTGTTNFGSVSLQATATPSVTIVAAPAGPICSGTSVTFTATPVNGGTPTYQWRIGGAPVAGATNNTYVNNTLTNGNTVSVSMTATGCVAPAAVNSNTITMTVQTPPNVSVSGADTYCNSATISATLLGTGTVYYQGVRYNGTSTATPSTSQTITTPGTHTFYFRASSSAGCWGQQDSAKVTINRPPTLLTINPVSSALCAGDSTMLVATATAPNVEVLQEDFNAGATGWTITNLTGIANAYWQIRRSPGYTSSVAGDGSPYMEAAPDATGAGVTTTTIVTSPSFSLVGYTSASLSFNQYVPTYVGDSLVVVEYSTDGITWTPFIDMTGVTTGLPSWLSTTPTTTMAIPAGALGMPSVQLRWNYKSTWGFYWAIDNITVNATPQLSYTWGGPAVMSCTTCDTVMVTPSTAGANVYNVTSSVSGCAISAITTITLNPLPVVFNVTGGGSYCAGGTGVNVLLSGSEAGVNYDLYNGTTLIATLPGTGAALDFGPQTTAGGYYIYAANATTLCTATMADSAVIVINPLPATITGTSSFCAGSNITLTEITTGGTWSSSDITIATTDTAGTVTGVAAGIADISYTLSTGCSATYSVTVNALPVIAPITGNTAVCASGTTTLANATAGGSWSSTTTSVATIDAAGLVTGVAAGTSIISYTVTDGLGCTAAATVTETVATPPVTVILPAGTYVTMCHGNPANLVATTLTGTSYQWSVGGTAIAGATNHNYIATTPGIYTLAMDNGVCAWTLPGKTVLTDPIAVISYNTTGNYLYTGTFSTYQWFRNGVAISGATSGILLSPAPGSYSVVVADITGCTDTAAAYTILPTGINTPVQSVVVKVFPNPASDMIFIDAPVNVHAVVLSPDGRIAKTANGNSVNVSDLANGMYLIQVYNEQNVLLNTARFSKIN